MNKQIIILTLLIASAMPEVRADGDLTGAVIFGVTTAVSITYLKLQQANQSVTASAPIAVSVSKVANSTNSTNTIATQLSTGRFSPLPRKPQTESISVVNPDALAQFYKEEDNKRMRRAVNDLNNHKTTMQINLTYTPDSANWVIVPYRKPANMQSTIPNYSITQSSKVVVPNKEQLKKAHKDRRAAIDQSKAATKIPADTRGFQARKQYAELEEQESLRKQSIATTQGNHDFEEVSHHPQLDYALEMIIHNQKIPTDGSPESAEKLGVIQSQLMNAATNYAEEHGIEDNSSLLTTAINFSQTRLISDQAGQDNNLTEAIINPNGPRGQNISAELKPAINLAQKIYANFQVNNNMSLNQRLSGYETMEPRIQKLLIGSIKEQLNTPEIDLHIQNYIAQHATQTPIPAPTSDDIDTLSDTSSEGSSQNDMTNACTIS